jgi:hypothetical protein
MKNKMAYSKNILLWTACVVLLALVALFVLRFGFSAQRHMAYNSIYAHLLIDSEIKEIAQTLKQQHQALKPNSKLDITFSTSPQDGTQASLDIAYIRATDTALLSVSVRQYLHTRGYHPVPCPVPCTQNIWKKSSATIQIVEYANHESLEIIKSELT